MVHRKRDEDARAMTYLVCFSEIRIKKTTYISFIIQEYLCDTHYIDFSMLFIIPNKSILIQSLLPKLIYYSPFVFSHFHSYTSGLIFVLLSQIHERIDTHRNRPLFWPLVMFSFVLSRVY